MPLKITYDTSNSKDTSEKEQLIPERQVFNVSDGTYRSDIREVDGNTSFSQDTQTTVNSSSIYLVNSNKAWKYINPEIYNRDTNEVRIKENKYGFKHVQSEILAAKIAGLTGIKVPYTYFGVGAEKHNPGLIAKLPASERTEPVYLVASQRLKGYMDLSTFIDAVQVSSLSEDKTLYNYILPADDIEKRQMFSESYGELTSLRKLTDTNIAANKMKKCGYMVSCINLMPQPIKDMLDEAYITSAFINNWDMYNFDLANMGVRILHKEDGIEIDVSIIDLGNSLYMGFGGKYKEDSFISANMPAKIQSDTPENIRYHDYDPSIPDMYKISAASAAFDGHPALLCGIIDKEMREKHRTIPRSLPFADLYKDINTQILNCLEGKRNENNNFSKGLMRGLYGISCITDEYIDAVVKEWYHLDKYLEKYPQFANPKPELNYSKEEFAGIIKERRDYLCNTFEAEIKQYLDMYPGEAYEKRLEVRNASEELTTIKASATSPKPALQKNWSSRHHSIFSDDDTNFMPINGGKITSFPEMSQDSGNAACSNNNHTAATNLRAK